MSEFGLYRCRICGEAYFGKHPSHCPHCGANAKYMTSISGWVDENIGVIATEAEKGFLAQTRDLEFHASRLYRASAKDSANPEIVGYFKYLARVEREHYEVACKLLGEKISDDINGLGTDSKGDDLANLEESKRLEEEATKLYRGFAEKSKTERIVDFFSALAAIEADHIELDTGEILKLK